MGGGPRPRAPALAGVTDGTRVVYDSTRHGGAGGGIPGVGDGVCGAGADSGGDGLRGAGVDPHRCGGRPYQGATRVRTIGVRGGGVPRGNVDAARARHLVC